MKKLLAAALLALPFLAPGEARAQGSCPYVAQKNVLTPGQWQFCFQAKQDALGYAPVNKAGDTMLGPLVTAPSTAGAAGFNLPAGAAPTTPNVGDLWSTGGAFYGRTSGGTQQLAGVGSGASVSGQPANPTGTTNATGVMMGLGSTCKLTPVTSGRIHVTWAGYAQNTGANVDTMTAYQGTGTAPTNGASLVGAAETPGVAAGTLGSGIAVPFTLTYVISGLVIGLPTWLDVALKASAGTATILSVMCTAVEF